MVQSLDVSPQPNVGWAVDFMSDTLYGGRRFRTFNLLDEGVPEVLAIEVNTSLPGWCADRGIALCFIQPGKPNQNAFVERFNRIFRHEMLDAYVFESLEQVREISAEWMLEYNEERPHDTFDRWRAGTRNSRPTSALRCCRTSIMRRSWTSKLGWYGNVRPIMVSVFGA